MKNKNMKAVFNKAAELTSKAAKPVKTVHIDEDLHLELSIAAKRSKKTLQDYINTILEDYVGKGLKGQGK